MSAISLIAGPYRTSDIVPFRFDTGIAIASYFVSLAGALLTVELLHVRVALKGRGRWIELGFCSIAFGLVGIWSMHYVGNYSIVMGNGDANLQLVYSAGFTALSAFIPIAAIFVVFFLADRRYKGGLNFLICLIVPGILAGAAICGMHYSGNLGISNYSVDFHLAYVGGAITIACVSSVAALGGFFILQDIWMSTFVTRFICAVFLAGTVSSMHWVASKGTIYRLKTMSPQKEDRRNTNFIAAIVVCLATIPMLLAVFVWQLRRRRQLADRAQQVVLACARFDPDGRLLVTQDGQLPSQKITVDKNQRAFEEDFDVTHPVFQWLFRASHNWPSIDRFVPRMRKHLQEVSFLPLPVRRSQGSAHTDDSDDTVPLSYDDYSRLFRESFCVAASDLAAEFRNELEDMGILYEKVMMTGTIMERIAQERNEFMRALGLRRETKQNDLESVTGLNVFGKGQLLVLASGCSRREASRYGAEGYRFETLEKISDRLAQNMQVTTHYVANHLQHLREIALEEPLPSPRGTLLGCFIMRPVVSKRCWDVAARIDSLERLPYVQLTPKGLGAEALAVVHQLDGLSVAECCHVLDERTGNDETLESKFADSFRARTAHLATIVAEPFFQHAVFSAKMLKIPTFDLALNAPTTCNLLVFHIIPDVHSSGLKSSPSLIYTPLSFFKCRQQCMMGAPHHASFDRQVQIEFASLAARTTSDTRPSRPPMNRSSSTVSSFMRGPKAAWWSSKVPTPSVVSVGSSKGRQPSAIEQGQELTPVSSPTSSQKNTVKEPKEPKNPKNLPFGGIMVSQDYTVESVAKIQREDSMDVLNLGLGAKSFVGIDETEMSTYVDELYEMARERWQCVERTGKRAWAPGSES